MKKYNDPSELENELMRVKARERRYRADTEARIAELEEKIRIAAKDYEKLLHEKDKLMAVLAAERGKFLASTRENEENKASLETIQKKYRVFPAVEELLARAEKDNNDYAQRDYVWEYSGALNIFPDGESTFSWLKKVIMLGYIFSTFPENLKNLCEKHGFAPYEWENFTKKCIQNGLDYLVFWRELLEEIKLKKYPIPLMLPLFHAFIRDYHNNYYTHPHQLYGSDERGVWDFDINTGIPFTHRYCKDWIYNKEIYHPDKRYKIIKQILPGLYTYPMIFNGEGNDWDSSHNLTKFKYYLKHHTYDHSFEPIINSGSFVPPLIEIREEKN